MYVHTDHQALQWLISIRDPTSKLARLALQLQHYDFEIIHRPGASNGNNDQSPVYHAQTSISQPSNPPESNVLTLMIMPCLGVLPVTNSGSRYIVVVL